MKRETIIYINSDIQNHEFIYTGIVFSEFIAYIENPIQNLLLLKANYLKENIVHNFEIVEGLAAINRFANEDIYDYGDFCFVDFEDGTLDNLSSQQIAELLYLAHMFTPLKSPYFESLHNRFAYLAHDDGFFGKIYCRKRDKLKQNAIHHKCLIFKDERWCLV